MRARLLVPALGLVLAATAALADILPPNARWIANRVRFENLKDHPDHVFFLVAERFGPPDQPRQFVVRPLDGNGETSLNHNPMEGSWTVYAVPRSLHDDPAAAPAQEILRGEGVLKSQEKIGQIRSAPLSEKRDTLYTVYRIDRADGALKLTLVSEDRPSREEAASDAGVDAGVAESGSWRWYVAVGGGAVGVLLVLWLLMRR